MISDIYIVTRKELQILFYSSRDIRTAARLAIWVIIFGLLLPSQSGSFWLESPMTIYYWTWIPLLFVTAAVTGVFAREREHHTLETLLASRLSDRAILIGKFCASVIYGESFTLASALLGLIVVNASIEGAIRFYTLAVGLGGLLMSILAAGLAGGVGMLIAMYAPTQQAAAQGLTIVALLMFVPGIAVNFLPDAVKATVEVWLHQAEIGLPVLAINIALLLIDALLLNLAQGRFKRPRLL